MTSVTEQHRQVVREAAEYLDLHWPTEEIGQPWWEVIHLGRLHMESVCRCVCGQLGARLAEHEGFKIDLSGNVVTFGHQDTSGFRLLRTPLGSMLTEDELGSMPIEGPLAESLRRERELAEKLAKRLGADPSADGPVIPERLSRAFTGNTPALWWRQEINDRRAGKTWT